MLEAFKNLDKKQKIWISIVVIIYLIILVISIKIIWFPKTDKLENEMTQYYRKYSLFFFRIKITYW